jgi:hypothetical protein
MDFNARSNGAIWDKLEFDVRGTEANFDSFRISTSGMSDKDAFNRAKAIAEQNMFSDKEARYEFATDGKDGWLFADTDGNHKIDLAIELPGVSDLSHLNIV